MIKYALSIISIILAYQLLVSCANVTAPTGGPRDTIAPVRIHTIPIDKSINYAGKTITMEFNERIKTDKIKEQLIITPLIESDYEFKIKKNTIKLTFEEPFQDSTTYTLNFRESIQDITEGNPTKENKFTFSTGNYLDSMSIKGYVKELLTYDTLESIVIGMYKADDTVTIANGSPYYFTEIEEDGTYLIENIKNGNYLIYAFEDANKNLKLETDKEIYGFVKDTIRLDTMMVQQNIDLIHLDLSKFKTMTALPSGQYFDINFNKYITDYDVKPINSPHRLLVNSAKENRSLRIYNNFTDIDSLQISFTAIDSIDTQISDTLFVKFIESKRKKEEFKWKLLPENKSKIEPKLEVTIDFNKPIVEVNTDSMFIQYDTTRIESIHDSLLHWNKHKDQLTFLIEIDKSKADTIAKQRIRFEEMKKDSLQKLNEEAPAKKQMAKTQQKDLPKINRGLQLYFGRGTFYSADMDTSRSKGYNYEFIKKEDFGIQKINVQTDYTSYTVQLVSEDFKIIDERENQKEIIFKNIPAGKYKIRVLIDSNNDGKWSPGNMLKQIEPEPVYIFPELLVIRADWETSLDLAF